MATTTEEPATGEELTVEITGPGGSTGAFPASELEQHAREIAGVVFRHEQLSFAVGGRQPNRSSVKTSVDLMVNRQLRKGQEIVIAVMTPEGEIMATTSGRVVAVMFEDEYADGQIVGCERVHKVKLGL